MCPEIQGKGAENDGGSRGEYFAGKIGTQIPRLFRARKISFYGEDASKEK